MVSENTLVSASPSAHSALLKWSHKAGSSEAEQLHLMFGARVCPFPGAGTTLIP